MKKRSTLFLHSRDARGRAHVLQIGLSLAFCTTLALTGAKANVNKEPFSTESITQQVPVTGTVNDDKGSPLAGATVRVRGTNTTTVTDVNGQFSISVPSSSSMLDITYTGYQTQEVRVGNQTS